MTTITWMSTEQPLTLWPLIMQMRGICSRSRTLFQIITEKLLNTVTVSSFRLRSRPNWTTSPSQETKRDSHLSYSICLKTHTISEPTRKRWWLTVHRRTGRTMHLLSDQFSRIWSTLSLTSTLLWTRTVTQLHPTMKTATVSWCSNLTSPYLLWSLTPQLQWRKSQKLINLTDIGMDNLETTPSLKPPKFNKSW